MNQITKMFMESNARMRKIMKGSFQDREIFAAQREFEGQVKLINSVVAMFGIQSKNKRAMDALNKMNLIDETTAIDMMLGDPEADKVKCPFHKELMTRADCLDYSGKVENVDDCRGCEIGEATKNMLLGDPR